MKKIIGFAAIIIFIFSAGMYAQDKTDYKNDPGYVDFGNLSEYLKNDNVTEVNIESYLLKMVGRATHDDDPELSKLLGGLKLIKVYSFNVDGKDHQEVISKISRIDKKLENDNWNRIVKVKSPGENTNVYIKTTSDQDHILGLVVTSLDKNGEAAFVNIVGRINLDAIGKLGSKFNIPSLDSLDNKGGHK